MQTEHTNVSTRPGKPMPQSNGQRVNPIANLLALTQVVKDLAPPDEPETAFMPLQAFEILMLIGLFPGITMNDLSERTGLAQSSVSRNVAMLSEYHRLGKPGFNLVETHEDPYERRRKVLFLNDKGRRALTRMASTLYPGQEPPTFPKAREHLDAQYLARRGR
jgi:DNA-binding MarR family transcriptional regulator